MTSLSLLAATAVFARSASAAGHGPPTPEELAAAAYNLKLTNYFYWTWAIVLTVLMSYTFFYKSHRYIRKIAGVGDHRQALFRMRPRWWGVFRKQLLDSPLFRTRHHREFQINSVINMGTLPSRFQSLFLTLYFVFQTIFLVYNIDFSTPRAEILGFIVSRSGVLAVVNMLPLFLLAARNNPFIKFCGISFDTFNLVHRWMGRMAVFMAIIHVFCWMGRKSLSSPLGWKAISFTGSSFILTGFIAFLAFVTLLITSPSALRHAFYETFLHIHIIGAAVSVGGLWYHLKEFAVMYTILKVVIGIWVTDRALRIFRVMYYNLDGFTVGTRTLVEILPGETVRITCVLPRRWVFQPGQHAYLYMPSIGWWTSHPLSLSWGEMRDPTMMSEIDTEKGQVTPVTAAMDIPVRTISFLCKRRTGFTDTLYRKALEAPDGRLSVTSLVEGPYGSQDLRSFGTVVLFAAGVGITHQMPHVRDLVSAYSTGAGATQKVLLVWTIREQEQVEWIRTWMTEVLAMPNRREVLRVMVYVTGSSRVREVHSPSNSVQMFSGRPIISSLMRDEVDTAVGAVGVSCCGVGAMADEIRNACRAHMADRSVVFMEESFTW